MTNSRSHVDDVQILVDRLFDGQIEPVELERLESLILEDDRCLQTYCERLDFHNELIEQANDRPLAAVVLDGLRQFSMLSEMHERKRLWRFYAALTASAAAIIVVAVAIFRSELILASPVGSIASLTTDLIATENDIELGQIVRRGQVLEIQTGIASFQLPEVSLDLVGPAKVRIDRSNQVSLLDGTLIATVSEAGVGFTVRTPDAEVIDLGTEFLVQNRQEEGTHVSVRRGAAQSRLLDWLGRTTKVVDLTAARAAHFNRSTQAAKEVDYSAAPYHRVDHSRGGILRISGAIRTVSEAPSSLRSNQTITPNHILIIPEQTVVLNAATQVNGLSGPVTLPAGASVTSYLIHYDPTSAVSFAPRGAVTFSGKIAAILGTSSSLAATDALFGNAETEFELEGFRELELDEDEIRLADDRSTVSFFFGVSPPEFLDEIRILVINAVP